MQPIVKWSTAIDAKVIKQQLRRAVRIATAYAPGPVHFDLPQSETKKPSGTLQTLPELMPNYYHPTPDARGIENAVAMIKAANRPVLLVGLGTLWDNASPAMIALAEHLGAPVLTTSKCKGAMPEDHLLRAGCIIGGLIERDLVSKADLIITIGLDAVELQPKGWPYTTKVLSFANHPSLDALVACNEEVIGALDPLLTAIVENVPQGSGWGLEAAKHFVTEFTQPWTRLPPACHPNALLNVRVRSCPVTRLPPVMLAPAVYWWCRNGKAMDRVNF